MDNKDCYDRLGRPAPGRGNSIAVRKAAHLMLFARTFFKHPNMVGWLLPSSPFLVDEVLKQIDWDDARVIVEYGPGVGSFTARLLERMRPDATLIAVELNHDLFRFLRGTFQDSRLRLVHGSATEIDALLAGLGYSEVDCIISGIPFKTLTPEAREVIVRKTHAVLRPRGRFLVYQFSNSVLPCLERVFDNVSRDVELLNILPARLFYCAR